MDSRTGRRVDSDTVGTPWALPFAAVGRRQSKPVEPKGPLTRDQIEGFDYEKGKRDGLDALLAACPFRKAALDIPTRPDPSRDRRARS